MENLAQNLVSKRTTIKYYYNFAPAKIILKLISSETLCPKLRSKFELPLTKLLIMKQSQLIIASLLTAAVGVLIITLAARRREHMGGYGILSGLYYNNRAQHCFKNPYDPPGYEYCETIGKVVI